MCACGAVFVVQEEGRGEKQAQQGKRTNTLKQNACKIRKKEKAHQLYRQKENACNIPARAPKIARAFHVNEKFGALSDWKARANIEARDGGVFILSCSTRLAHDSIL